MSLADVSIKGLSTTLQLTMGNDIPLLVSRLMTTLRSIFVSHVLSGP